MRAAIYRSLDAKNTMLGLSFPTEFVLVLACWWAGMLCIGAGIGSLGAIAVYIGIRALNYGRAEGFVQHYLQWKVRQVMTGGRLCAAARVPARRAKRFPFGGGYAFAGEDLALRVIALVGRKGGGGTL
jgi:hypothetical protein